MTATKKKRHSFARGLAIYVIFLTLLIVVGLIFFYFFISAYEYSRPEGAMNRYIEDIGDEAFQSKVDAFVATLDHNIQPEAESRQRVLALFEDVKWAKKVSECTDTKLVYVLKSGSTVLGKVTLVPSEDTHMGFSTWEVSEDELTLDFLYNDAEQTVPAGYHVRCGDYILDDSYIVDDQVHYKLLEEFYENYKLPTKRTYRTGKVIGDVQLEILDPNGNVVTEADLDEEKLTDNCSAEEKAAIKEFTDLYIERYVIYLSGSNGAHTPNLYALLVLTVRDSDLYSRLYQALGGQGFASSRGDFLQSITINHTIKISEDSYVVDVTYLVDTYGQNGAFTTTTNNSKLILVQTVDGLRAIAQASY